MAKTLYTNLTELTKDKRFTFLNQDVVSGGTTIRIQNLAGFENPNTSSGQIVLLGEIGQEKAKLYRTSATAYPSTTYNDITLQDSLIFDYPQDTKVTIVDFNRVETQWAATVNGTKATVAAYPNPITPDLPEMLFIESSATSGYFFQRFNNTLNNTNTDWSDAIPYAGYGDNTVFEIKRRALENVDEEIDGKLITHEFLDRSLWEARREFHQAPGKRPFRRRFNIDIGDALTGSYRIDLPTWVEKPHTAENIYGVRIGTEENMTYIDKKAWDEYYNGVAHSSLTAAYTVSTSRDLYLVNARDFDESGVVTVEGTPIEYSAKSNSGGTLRISTHGSYSVSAGSEVWQNATYGLPDKFTVFASPGGSAHIYFNRPIDTAYIDQNVYLDAYQTLSTKDSDADELDEPDYDMYVPYLSAKIKHKKNRGAGDITADPDYKIFLSRKENALNNEYLATEIRIYPDIEHLP